MNFIGKHILLLFCLLFFLQNIRAQQAVLDSLTNELTKHIERDSSRVNILNALAYKYCTKDVSKAIIYAEESEKISVTINFKKGKAESTYVKGFIQEVQFNLDKALAYYEDALEMYKQINFQKGISSCYIGIGVVNYYQGNYEEAILFYKNSIAVNEEIRNTKKIGSALNNIALVYGIIGNHQEALSYYKRALRIYEEVNYKQGIASCYGNIGMLYFDKGNYPLSLDYYNKSLAIHEEFGDTLKIAISSQNVGGVYYRLQNYDKALVHFGKALEISKRNNQKSVIASAIGSIGLVYRDKKEYQKSIDFQKEALQISKEIDDKILTVTGLNNIADVYLLMNMVDDAYTYYEQARTINSTIENHLGTSHSLLGIAKVYLEKRKYDKAFANVMLNLKISEKHGLLEVQKTAQKLLSEIYEQKGDYKNALASYEQFKKLNDSLFNKDNVEKITQLEYEYKYKQELDSASIRELKLTRTVKSTSQDLEKSQRNSFIGVIVILVMSMIFGALVFGLKLRNANTVNQNILVEQKLLRSQMTPHFIFNSLAVLQGMILNKEEGKSISYLSKFSKLLRTTLENSRYNIVSLSEEISAVDSYMALQNLDVNPPFNYDLFIDSNIDAATFKIPPMLIQPFIENAIEHAFVAKNENKEIKVNITLKDNALVCTIADNGIGVSIDKLKIKKNKKSLATTITAERLKMISKDYKATGSITVQNREIFGDQGTLVTLVIPYKTDTDLS